MFSVLRLSIIVVLLLVRSCLICGGFGNYTLVSRNFSPLFGWDEVVVPDRLTVTLKATQHTAKNMVSIPVYVSLATVSFRVDLLNDTLHTIMNGIVVPTHTFVFLSKEPYLLDDGVKTLPDSILSFARQGLITVVYTKNIGPHRKLLPILQRFYHRDALIVNIDDDMAYQADSSLLYQLLHAYKHSAGDSVVALRSRRIGLCKESVSDAKSLRTADLFSRYENWEVHYVTGRTEMFILPTGTGGVLYRPRFFPPAIFDPVFLEVTGTADDLMFRLACMATNTSVLIACRDLEQNNKIVRRCPIEEAYKTPAAATRSAKGRDAAAAAGRNSTATGAAVAPARAPHPHPHLRQHVQHRAQQLYHLTHTALSSSSPPSPAHQRALRTSLYHLNIGGNNDKQWDKAVQYLEQRGLINMTALFQQYHREREGKCYQSTGRVAGSCSIDSCRQGGHTRRVRHANKHQS
jgi:hypothetical protein